MSNFLHLKGPWDRMRPFQIASIIDDKNGLTIKIEDNQKYELKGHLRFSAHHAYRNFNEADLHGYWKELGGAFTTGIYVASDSELMRWAAKQSIDRNLHRDIKHYMVVSVEDVLEVLSFEPPEFEAD